jgi:hypothetical protein
MSFLYPLFLAGVAAVALPIVLHMIRRHTRNRVAFSSLMFLRTTTPRFRHRSRLENILLLIFRCLVLCLLAFGFARPFLPKPAAESPARAGRRIVVLVDTSASMRRSDLWPQAMDEATSTLRDTEPADRVCLMSFDRGTQTLVGFEQWAQLDVSRRAGVAVEALSEVPLSWSSTGLDNALIAAAEAIEDDEVNGGRDSVGIRRIVLVSDLQVGSTTETLRNYEWPEHMELDIRAVRAEEPTNAGLQLVTDRDALSGSPDEEAPKVRVTNGSEAVTEQFELQWADGSGQIQAGTTQVYVAAGRSTVARAPDTTGGSVARRLVLAGDDHDFDNILYVAPRLQQPVNILYVGGDDPNDPQEMLFYVRRAFGAASEIEFHVTWRPGDRPLPAADVEAVHLVIVCTQPTSDNVASLRRHIASGGTLLLVMDSVDASATLAGLMNVRQVTCEEADVNRYAMLARIEFAHPLLTAFSDPRFGDFTRVHFWQHRTVHLGEYAQAEVLARFDNGDPAWFEVASDGGPLLVLASGWHPADSDLALSSKFVPLLYSILEYGGVLAGRQLQYFVGDSVPLPSQRTASAGWQIRRPDGSVTHLETDQQSFGETNLPGIYTLDFGDESRLFAVNLPPRECRTDPMPMENLETLGVTLKAGSDIAAAPPARAGLRENFAEMEQEQKLWRWILVSVLAVLLVETWLAGRTVRSDSVSEGA